MIASSGGSIVQSNHYYPFGMSFTEGSVTSHQSYKYNGKELDTERGLNLYDYSARYMDPALGRVNTVDPIAEKYYSIIPYAYCMNNPMKSPGQAAKAQQSLLNGIESIANQNTAVSPEYSNQRKQERDAGNKRNKRTSECHQKH